MAVYYSTDKARNPQLKSLLDEVLDITLGHDHDGVNTKAVVGGAPGAGSVTNAMLNADVKVGSLAAFTTADKSSVQGAINELDIDIGSPAALTTTIKTSAVAAINELHADMGDVATLTTTSKILVGAINEIQSKEAADVTLTGIQTLTNKTLTSPTLTTPKLNDGGDGCTVTSANQTNAAAVATIPDFLDAADEFVMKDTAQTLTLKTLTAPVITSPIISDDSILTLGTTVATAETKITMEFDETTTGIGIVARGTTAVPQVLNVNPGAAVIADTINILHSAGAGDCNDLIASYQKVAVSGDGDAGITVVGTAPRAYVGTTGGTTVAAQAYGCQPWAKHEGTGAITAMSGVSALVDVNADNFTATTVNAGHFHIEGAATVTGQFDGVMIEAYPDVTCMDSGLAIAVDGGAVVTSAIRITGAPVCQMTLSSGAKVFTGTAANAAAVFAEVGAADAVGSIYISTGGSFYVQVANAGAASDWEQYVGLATTSIMTNKTLTAPVITSPNITYHAATHDYAGGAVDWTLSATELKAYILTPTNANGVCNAIVADTANKIYTVVNGSGFGLTVKTAAGTGITIANAKTAMVMSDGVNVIRISLDA